MYDIKTAVTLLRKKYSNIFFIAILIFIMSVLMVITGLLIVINQYEQMNKDFMNNENTHIIELSSNDMESDVNGFRFSETADIEKSLSEYNGKYHIIPVYQFPIGIEMGNPYNKICYLHGVENDALEVLGAGRLKSNEGIFIDDDGENFSTVTLKIPKIKLTDGGGSSDKYINQDFDIKSVLEKNMPLSIFEGAGSELYINKKAYEKIIETSFDVDFETFMKKYDEGEDYMISVMPAIYVYVNDLDYVKPIGEKLDSNGYATRYTFKAFEDFASSIDTTSLLLAIMVAVLFIVISAVLVIYFFNYYRSQQKDMGILLHMGFNRSDIVKIYEKNLRTCFALVLSAGLLYCVLGTLLFIDYSRMKAMLFTGVSTVILVIIVYLIITIILRKIVKHDIMYLIRFSKEVE